MTQVREYDVRWREPGLGGKLQSSQETTTDFVMLNDVIFVTNAEQKQVCLRVYSRVHFVDKPTVLICHITHNPCEDSVE